MCSILLVEDEKIELDTLKNYVDWKGLGIDQVFTARGGRSALELINSEEPDILITDIQMPGMSGIDLVEIVREEGHRCKVIFLTGYDKFEYAKEAIRLQVEEFLLKPFQVEEVESAVRKLLVKIDIEEKERQFNRLAMGKLLERACMGDVLELDNLAEFYFHKPAELVTVFILAFRGISETAKSKIQKSAEILHAFNSDQMFFVILPSVIAPEIFLRRSERILQDEWYHVICCDGKAHLAELHGICQQIRICDDDLFYAEEKSVMSVNDHIDRKPYEDRIGKVLRKQEILDAILSGQEKTACEILEECLASFGDMNKDGYCQNAFSLFLYLHRQMDNTGNIDGTAEVPNILHARHQREVQANFERYISQCCEAGEIKNTSRWAAHVQEFVQQHYMEDCSVEEMSEKINVSPNYLRRKFKEETGMTILEYTTETRLRMAVRLLENRDMKIKDVSLAVGYPNISYFTQLFSKKYGVTPNEYKKNN